MSKDSPENDDMRAEYDFSSAVRGKYANRFREAAPDWVSRIAAQDIRQCLANALLGFQRAEGVLVAYFVLVQGLDANDASLAADALLGNETDARDAAFWNDVRAHGNDLDSLQQRFAAALPFRDWLLHRGLLQFDLSSPAEFDFERVSEATEAASRLESELHLFVLARCRADGLGHDEAVRRTTEVIENWAAA